MKKHLLILMLIAISTSLLSGCKTQEGSSTNPVTGNQTQGTSGAGYPAPEISTEPAYPAPSGQVVAENASRMTVEVLSLTPSANDPQNIIIHVKVNSSAAVEGKTEYNPNLAGTEIDINLTAADAAGLAVGSVLSLTVSFRADNWGGGYYGSEISIQQ